MNQQPANVTLRAERAEDRPFLESLYASTRESELAPVPWSAEQKLAFLASQFTAQHSYYHQVYPDASYDVIERDGAPIGRLCVNRTADEVRILDIALIAECRGQGIGGELMRALMEETASHGQRMALSVERFNSARRLYERLGFRTEQETDIYLHMEWRPARQAA